MCAILSKNASVKPMNPNRTRTGVDSPLLTEYTTIGNQYKRCKPFRDKDLQEFFQRGAGAAVIIGRCRPHLSTITEGTESFRATDW